LTSFNWFFDLWTFTGCKGFDPTGAEPFPGLIEPVTVRRAQQPVISHLHESVRQPVLEKATKKLFGRDRAGVDLIGGRFLVLKRDLALVQLENPVMADGHAKDVRSQISQGVLASADGLTVNDPVFFPDLVTDEREQIGLFQVISDLGAEHHRQGLDRDEEVGAAAAPLAVS